MPDSSGCASEIRDADQRCLFPRGSDRRLNDAPSFATLRSVFKIRRNDPPARRYEDVPEDRLGRSKGRSVSRTKTVPISFSRSDARAGSPEARIRVPALWTMPREVPKRQRGARAQCPITYDSAAPRAQARVSNFFVRGESKRAQSDF